MTNDSRGHLTSEWASFLAELERAIRFHQTRRGSSRSAVNQSSLGKAANIGRNKIASYLKGETLLPFEELGLILRAIDLDPGSTVFEGLAQSWRQADDSFPANQLFKPGAKTVIPNPGTIENDGFVQINTWSSERPLHPDNLKTTFGGETDATRHELRDVWERLRDEGIERGLHGSVGSLEEISSFDHRESTDQQSFEVTVGHMHYAGQLATREITNSNRSYRDKMIYILSNEGYVSFCKQVLPSAIATNVSVLTSDGKTLLNKRSAAVETYANEWSVGINETMAVSPQEREDFFGLVRRGLKDELGVLDGHIQDLALSWFGYCFDCGNFYVFASARLSISADETSYRFGSAKEQYESAGHTWLQFTQSNLQRIVDGRRTPDDRGRWLHHASLASVELWRRFG